MKRRGMLLSMAASAVVLSACTAGTPPPGPPPSTPPPARGTIAGVVTAGPTCPVETPDRPCPPKPVQADLKVAEPSGAVVATVRTGADGSYRVGVAAGSYTVTVQVTGPFPSCAPLDVTVKAGQTADGDIDCDTGIR